MALPIGPIVAAAGAFLTFVFSFVQIVKADSDFVDIGWSVWTQQPGFFGVGTWIPVFALVAGAAALARAFAKGLDTKQVLGFGLLQVQLAAVAFAVLLWLGYVVSILLSEDTALGLGAFLLFLSLAVLVAGTAFSILDAKKGTTTTVSASSGPPSGQWGAPAGPQPHTGGPGSGQWPQPTPPPPPQDPSGQWQQPGAAPPPPPPQPAPGQWQPDPAGAPGPPAGPPPAGQTWSPPGPEQAWQPPPAPAPAAPPAPPAPGGGALIDPGTEVIPGPPPAPPRADPGHVGGGPDALPPVPPSNTP